MLTTTKRTQNVKTTTYEYDSTGNVVKKIVVEDIETPEFEQATVCSIEDDGIELCDEITVEPGLLEYVECAAGIASIVASLCLIAKALRD